MRDQLRKREFLGRNGKVGILEKLEYYTFPKADFLIRIWLPNPQGDVRKYIERLQKNCLKASHLPISSLEKLRARCRSGEQNLWDVPDFSGAHILSCKKEKKSLDLQIYSRISQTIKQLQWIQNTIVNTSVLVIFWCLLRWCRARDLFGSQISVTTGGFELRISCIRSSYLTYFFFLFFFFLFII